MLSQPVPPALAVGGASSPLSMVTPSVAEPAQATTAPASEVQAPLLSPLQNRAAATTLRDHQSQISLLQMADDATQNLAEILQQMKDLVAQIGSASLDATTRSLAQQQFNSLASRIDGMTSRAQHLASGDNATELASTTAAMASALSAVTASYSGIQGGAANASVDLLPGNAAVYIDALSVALDSVSVVRTMILASAQSLIRPELNALPTNMDASSVSDPTADVDSISQAVNINIYQALEQAGSGILKDGATISALVAFLLQDSSA